MAIKIPFIADVANFLKGTKNMEDSLEDVSDALDDLGRNNSTEQLERGLKDVGTAADASAEKIETSFDSAFKAVKAEGGTVKQKLKSDLDGVGGEGGAFKDFSDEAKQNLAESVSSFQGNAESAVDAVQSTFGGLATALGPAGVVGAALAAAGIGLVRGMATKAEEAVKAVSEKAAEMVGDLIDATPQVERINRALEELASTATTRGKFWWADASTELLDLRDNADKAGVSFTDVALGMAGSTNNLTAALAAVNEQLRINQDESIAAAPGVSIDDLVQQEEALQKLKTQLENQRTSLDVAEASTAAYAVTAEGQADATSAAWEALKNENDELRESKRLKGDAKEATWDMKDALDGVTAAAKENGKSLSDNTAKGRENQRAIKSALDAVNDFGDAQLDATGDVEGTNKKLKAQEDVLVNQVMKAFGLTEKEARDYITTLGGIPRKKETDVDVSDNGTVHKTQVLIDSITGKPVTVGVKPDIPGFNQGLNDYLSGKTFQVNVKPKVYGSVKLVQRTGSSVWDWKAI